MESNEITFNTDMHVFPAFPYIKDVNKISCSYCSTCNKAVIEIYTGIAFVLCKHLSDAEIKLSSVSLSTFAPIAYFIELD